MRKLYKFNLKFIKRAECDIIMPVDPVCGIELDKDAAVVHSHEDKEYYFCCDGCRKIFIKKPRKWKK
ncbi:MAG: YHS domain-containing protein [Candidatus Nitrosoabyssus spongiisocia]|nr:MAG: YHS domain-containing protein [Nitrosopumilaceae archaeon AB1(1)]